MGVLIDSDVLIGFERGKTDVRKWIAGREEEEFFISVITASELLYGVHRAKAPDVRSRRMAWVESVLNAFPVIPIDVSTARAHAELSAYLETAGMRIGLHDAWIAATCIAHGLTLVTGNVREFGRVPGLRVEKWK
jgi:tRNA(fMet)-specific endonuclease VapC